PGLCTTLHPSANRSQQLSNDLRHLVELDVVEVAVETVLRQQLLVDAGGLDTPVVQEEDAVARANRRDAVRQEDDRPARQEPGQRVVEQVLRLVVELLLWLLDDQERRVADDGTGQGDAVLLAGRQGVTQFADDRFVTL